MIHLFPKLDHTVEKLSLYMSFLTERYIVMGQMPDNSLEEQLEVIRPFTEELSGRRDSVTTTSRPRSVIMPLRRRPASLEVIVRGPDRREGAYSTSSAVSRTVPRQAVLCSSALSTGSNHSQTYGTTHGRACNLCAEATTLTEATQTSEDGATPLGHTDGNLQASGQEEESTNNYPASKASKRPEEDRGQA